MALFNNVIPGRLLMGAPQEAGVVIYPDGSQAEIVLAEGRAWFKRLRPKRKLLLAPYGLPLNQE